ncbi:DnaD domain protein [Clostridium sardiniense]
MATIRINKDKKNPYVMLNKTALNDEKLSWKAKGIFAYLMSKPDDWVCKIEDLKKHAKDGADSVKAGLRELREHGYMIKRPIRNNKNVIVEWEEALFETPQEEAKKIFGEQEARRVVSLEKRRNKSINGKSINGKSASGENPTNGKSTNGNSTSGKPAFIINNELPNTELLTNEISSSSSKEEQFNYLINLYSEHYGVITNGRKRKLYNYFAESNFEFMKMLIEYVIDQRATKHSYFDKTIEALFKKEIKTAEGFVNSIQNHYKDLKNKNSKSANKTYNNSNTKKTNIGTCPQRDYNYDILEKRLRGFKDEDIAEEYGITVDEVIRMSQPTF